MSSRAARLAFACALAGLAASGSAALGALPPAQRSDVSELLRRQRHGQLHAGVPEPLQHGRRRAGRALRGDLVRVRGARCSVAGMRARQAVRESVPGYLFAVLDARAGRDPLSRIRVVRDPEARLHPLPDHVRRRDRALPRVRRGDLIPHDHFASSRGARPPRRPDQPARHRADGPLPRRRGVGARVLPARGRAGRAGGRGGAGADTGAAVRVRALVRRASRACRSSCRRWARRCWSSSSTTSSARRAASRTWRYKPIFAKYDAEQPGAVRVVLKDYPLDSECNANVANGGPHPSACEAAVAVRLAREHNREDADGGMAVRQPAVADPGARPPGRRTTSAASPTSTRGTSRRSSS